MIHIYRLKVLKRRWVESPQEKMPMVSVRFPSHHEIRRARYDYDGYKIASYLYADEIRSKVRCVRDYYYLLAHTELSELHVGSTQLRHVSNSAYFR